MPQQHIPAPTAWRRGSAGVSRPQPIVHYVRKHEHEGVLATLYAGQLLPVTIINVVKYKLRITTVQEQNDMGMLYKSTNENLLHYFPQQVIEPFLCVVRHTQFLFIYFFYSNLSWQSVLIQLRPKGL